MMLRSPRLTLLYEMEPGNLLHFRQIENQLAADGSLYVLKFRYISYVHFLTLAFILLLSLCFGSTCTPLPLLQLRYILWCFIDCFGIIFVDLTVLFYPVLRLLCISYALLLVMIFLIFTSHPHSFTHMV